MRTRNHITAPRRRARTVPAVVESATIARVPRRQWSRSLGISACLGAAGVACGTSGLPVRGGTNAGVANVGGASGSPSPAREIVLAIPAPPTAVPRLGGRNPFAFALAAPPVAHTPAQQSTSPVDEVLPVPAAVPLLTLIGIAERGAGPQAPRTAIISGVGEVFLAAIGDVVASRYVVRAIGDSHVELADRTSGDTLRLALRASR